MLLSPNSCDSQEPVPEAKDLVVTLEKWTIPYLSVSARISVIDPFNQIKREYNTILDDADSANRITLSHLRALHDALRQTFLKVTNNEMLTAKRRRSKL